MTSLKSQHIKKNKSQFFQISIYNFFSFENQIE